MLVVVYGVTHRGRVVGGLLEGVGADGVEGGDQFVERGGGVVAGEPECFSIDWVEGATEMLLLTVVDWSDCQYCKSRMCRRLPILIGIPSARMLNVMRF